jgi:hypothetical protein
MRLDIVRNRLLSLQVEPAHEAAIVQVNSA